MAGFDFNLREKKYYSDTVSSEGSHLLLLECFGFVFGMWRYRNVLFHLDLQYNPLIEIVKPKLQPSLPGGGLLKFVSCIVGGERVMLSSLLSVAV